MDPPLRVQVVAVVAVRTRKLSCRGCVRSCNGVMSTQGNKKRIAYLKRQQEYYARQQEYYASYTMQQQQAIQVRVNG